MMFQCIERVFVWKTLQFHPLNNVIITHLFFFFFPFYPWYEILLWMQVRHQKTEIVFSRIDSCCCKTSSVHSQSWWFVEIKKKSFILKKIIVWGCVVSQWKCSALKKKIYLYKRGPFSRYYTIKQVGTPTKARAGF